MGGYLLDTHAAIWFFNGDSALSEAANQIISDISNPLYISMASAWELAIKISIGKLDFAGKTAGFLRFAEINEIAVIPIEANHLSVFEELPPIHRDPFDRLLVATAIAEGMVLITADENIVRYGVSCVW